MSAGLRIATLLVAFLNILSCPAQHIEAFVLSLLGASPDHLATTSLHMFPSAQVVSFIDENIGKHIPPDILLLINRLSSLASWEI